MIVQFIYFKVLLLVRNWCYFVALGLSKEVWKGMFHKIRGGVESSWFKMK